MSLNHPNLPTRYKKQTDHHNEFLKAGAYYVH